MLRSIGNDFASVNQSMATSVPENNRYMRNEMDDMKKALELLFEFKEKISKLHPNALDMIDHLLQRQNNRY